MYFWCVPPKHFLVFVPHTYLFLFDPFTNICTSFITTLIYKSFLYYGYSSTVQVRALILGYRFRDTIFSRNCFAATAQKREQQQQQQQRISAYLLLCLSGVHCGPCWTLYVFPVSSREPLCILGRFYVFLYIIYASKLASVGNYSSIKCDPVHFMSPRISLCCSLSNLVHYQCYRIISTIVRWQI